MQRISQFRDNLTMDIIKDNFYWLLMADIENAVVGWVDGQIVWYGGVWSSGTFANGIWKGGVFECGVFEGDLWEDGSFVRGAFYNGVWVDGQFFGGTFFGKEWKNGYFNGCFKGDVWVDGEFGAKGVWEGRVWNRGDIWDKNMDAWVESDVDPNEYFKNKN
jgi:hypothetical protein